MNFYRNVYRLLAFTLLLLAFRVWHTAAPAYLFLIWNLFLAWLPLQFILKFSTTKHQGLQAVLLSLTVLFLPNAPYLITDLFHLGKQSNAPLWLDTLLLSSFAILGCILFVQTLVLFFAAIQSYFSSRISLFLIKIALCCLTDMAFI